MSIYVTILPPEGMESSAASAWANEAKASLATALRSTSEAQSFLAVAGVAVDILESTVNGTDVFTGPVLHVPVSALPFSYISTLSCVITVRDTPGCKATFRMDAPWACTHVGGDHPAITALAKACDDHCGGCKGTCPLGPCKRIWGPGGSVRGRAAYLSMDHVSGACCCDCSPASNV